MLLPVEGTYTGRGVKGRKFEKNASCLPCFVGDLSNSRATSRRASTPRNLFFKTSWRRSRSILQQFVPEFPRERNDRHRAVPHGRRLPKPATAQGDRLPLRTNYLADLGRSKAQASDR
jgi:hypothetical protein